MNRLEMNCSEAVLDYLATSAVLALVPVAPWETTEEQAETPRVSVRVQQREEMVYGWGVHALDVEVKTTVDITSDAAPAIDTDIQTLLADSGFLEDKLTTAKFHCFGRRDGPSRESSSSDGKRVTQVSFTVVGFDLERFDGVTTIGDNDGNSIDFGGGVEIDVGS